MAAQPQANRTAPRDEAERQRAALHTVALLLMAMGLALLLAALLAASPARSEPAIAEPAASEPAAPADAAAFSLPAPDLPDASALPVESRPVARDINVPLPPLADMLPTETRPVAIDVTVPLPPAITGEPAAARIAEIAPPDLPVPAPYIGRVPVAIALAALLDSGTPDHAGLPRSQRDAVAAFYETRDFAPLWIAGEQWAPAARAVMARLWKADEDGLDRTDYVAPILDPLPSSTREREAVLASAELRLSLLAVRFARDARGGRLNPTRISALITPELTLPDARDVLSRLIEAPDANAALGTWLPQHEGYRNLRKALAALRATRPATPDVRVPPGPSVKVGMRDPRVPLVRARFGIGPSPEGEPTTYDERVASAVAQFQKSHGLPASGVLTRQTVAALGGASRSRREADILANMERWRWLPPELGERHVFVNVPAFNVKLVDDGKIVHSARVIVGKTKTATPIFSDEMDHLVINPSWYVPPSILRRDFLPKLATDPGYAARNGYELRRNGRSVSVRQPPGPKNALGAVKFMFPNEHAVYLHDTPNKRLFANASRAYSAGCVRVENPMKLAELLLGSDWTQAKLNGLVGRGERRVNLPRKVPVHLAYFTLSADPDGTLSTLDDIYGIDARMRDAMGLRG